MPLPGSLDSPAFTTESSGWPSKVGYTFNGRIVGDGGGSLFAGDKTKTVFSFVRTGVLFLPPICYGGRLMNIFQIAGNLKHPKTGDCFLKHGVVSRLPGIPLFEEAADAGEIRISNQSLGFEMAFFEGFKGGQSAEFFLVTFSCRFFVTVGFESEHVAGVVPEKAGVQALAWWFGLTWNQQGKRADGFLFLAVTTRFNGFGAARPDLHKGSVRQDDNAKADVL